MNPVDTLFPDPRNGDPRYGAYGPVAALALVRATGMSRMVNPAIVALALANATALGPIHYTPVTGSPRRK
jgi:hypothetical protein